MKNDNIDIANNEVYKQAKEVQPSKIQADAAKKKPNYKFNITMDSEKMWKDAGVEAYESYKFGMLAGKNKDFEVGSRFLIDVMRLFESYIRKQIEKSAEISDKADRTVELNKIGDALESIIPLYDRAGIDVNKEEFVALINGYAIGVQQDKEYVYEEKQ